ncbi:MAG TPA: pentapeptide repeat-containing protein [Verrucomicrobiales bacterium]|jgi:uncharacterized protein YjbI with pentapeptide repeats|nr:pentapeptide repeat-containing protein [Verrucomicrobiales bacterium]
MDIPFEMPHDFTVEGARLSESKIINTDLSRSQFRDVALAGAQFIDVNLTGAVFEDVAMKGVVIRNANCTELSIEDACYHGMRIDGILVEDLLKAYRSQQDPPVQ